jgi:hypothetical protein
MSNNTYAKDISFLSLSFEENTNEWKDKLVTKKAVFTELNRRDRKQHKLHFAIVRLFSTSYSGEVDDKKVNLDSDEICDITTRYIKDMLIPGSTMDEFTEGDKKEFLNDSGALIEFGYWLVSEKLIPFFLNLMQTQSG